MSYEFTKRYKKRFENRTKMWDTITNEFFVGWSKDYIISESENAMINEFINSPRYENLTMRLFDEEILKGNYSSYSNTTNVRL